MVKLSNGFAIKLMNTMFTRINNSNWLKTFYNYIINSKYRKYKRLDKFLKDQISNPNPILLQLAKQFKTIKDNDKKVVKILRWVKNKINYAYDENTYDMNEYWANAIMTYNKGRGDCLKWDTKLLNDKNELINIENIKINDFIVGKDGKLVKVINKLNKGRLPTKRIFLNNGSEVIATNDHKFLTREGKEILCKDLRVGTLLKECKNIMLYDNDEEINTDYWYLKGLFIADGWTDNFHKDIFISGLDGDKKELQKEWVKQYCKKNNIKYRWDKKSICVHSRKLYEDFINCGTHAINKHVDVMPKNVENIKALLEGLKADANIRTRNENEGICFGTISTKLKNQIRVLYRILGKSTSEKLNQPTKTQFGKNPIWRIYVRNSPVKLKVKGILENKEEQVYDIEVENHEIYLPENDLLVHNCDDINSFIYVLARLSGVPSYLIYSVIGQVKEGGHYWNIYLSTKTNNDKGFSIYPIDGTYYYSGMDMPSRTQFNLTNNKYQKIWYIFNENNIFKQR